MSATESRRPSQPIRCMVVDDDAEIRVNVAGLLESFGMQVSTASNATALKQDLVSTKPDVIVLDIMLPDGNGLDLCRWIHDNSAAAVIMLTARGDTISRVVGLEFGADDYLGKPFEPRELVARIHAVVRRARGPAERRGEESVVQIGQWTFDRLGRQIESASGVVTALSNAEFRLLQAFVTHPKRLLSRHQLIDYTRAPGVEINDRTMDLNVSRLRTKLGEDARNPRIIRTIRGEGYLFDPEA